MIRSKNVSYLILLITLLNLAFVLPVFASPTDGTIDSTNKYAWAENAGFVNFAANTGNVHITDAGLTGHIWDSVYGWINLNPTNAGVANDGQGNLSGKAWSQGAGFIDFSGVIINTSGRFTGQAEGSVYGRLNFDCTNCNVTTDYRPSSVRQAPPGTGGFPVPNITFSPISTEVVSLPQEIIDEINQQDQSATSTATTERELTEFELLLAHFPKFKNILVQLGVNIDKENEALKKIRNVNFSLSGFLNASLSLIDFLGIHLPYPSDKLATEFKGFSLAKLPANIKQNIPEEVVFARGGDSNIDIPVNLKVNQKGQLNKSVEVLANKTITLVVRPISGKKIDSVIGYLVFKDDLTFNKTKTVSIKENFLSNLLRVAYAQDSSGSGSDNNLSNAEDLMVLNKFEYTDPDRDGLYTARINTPYSRGEYEIVTVINYTDQNSPRVLRLITLIDPEGYIYQSAGANETRIRNATVSMLQLNIGTNQFELWKAKVFAQKNPQITDQTGSYSFLVPEGTYKLQVEAEGYETYISDSFTAEEGDSLHGNIELFPKKSKPANIMILLILSALVLSALFYVRRRHIIQTNNTPVQ